RRLLDQLGPVLAGSAAGPEGGTPGAPPGPAARPRRAPAAVDPPGRATRGAGTRRRGAREGGGVPGSGPDGAHGRRRAHDAGPGEEVGGEAVLALGPRAGRGSSWRPARSPPGRAVRRAARRGPCITVRAAATPRAARPAPPPAPHPRPPAATARAACCCAWGSPGS